MIRRTGTLRGRWVGAAVLCLLAAASTAAQSSEPAPERTSGNDLEGQRVAAVRVVTEEGAVLEENPAALPLKAGLAYDSELVRESLRALHASGRYAEIRAEAAEAAGGLRIDFVVQRNFYVNRIVVQGLEPPPNESTAVATLSSAGLALGEIFRESLLEQGLERLTQELHDEGFYQAKLARELQPNAETRQMDILVRVTPGPRARLGAIQVSNQTDFPDERLLRRSKLKPGQTATSARIERGAERVRKYLTDRGHLGARVVVRRGEFDAAQNTLPLAMEISAGPRVRVELSGTRISQSELRRLLPIYEEAAVDQDLLQEGRRNLRDYFERQGYFDSQVSFTHHNDPEKGEQVISYTIERGSRRRLADVAFRGNRFASNDLLRRLLRIEPAAFLAPGRFSQRLLRDDEEAIARFYVANGFRQVQVTSEIVENYGGKEGDLFVIFDIAEGPQTLVGEFHLQGNETLDSDALLWVVGSSPGQPYSEFNVLTDRDNILALYYNEGFPEARLEWQAEELEGGTRVRLTYRIAEGPQRTVERVLLDGYHYTRRGIIAREVELAPGEPLREGDVVESQRALYNLGLFSRVQIAPQNPRGTDPRKNVVVLVEEARRWTLAYGGGIEVQRLGGAGADPVQGEVRASPRGIFEISKANFGGRPHTLSFKGRASTLQGRALLGYTAQNFLTRRSLSLLLTGFADKTRDVRTFTATRFEASGQLVQQVTPISSLFYRYSYRRVSVDAESLRVDPGQIPLFSQPTKISSLGITWIRDRRNSPSEPTRGTFHNADISIAAKPLGSGASFARLFLHQSSFHPVRGRIVFARSLRVGLQEPFSDTGADEIPLPERFFAGGGNSLRGFGLNQAGPRDPLTGFPVGGLAVLSFHHELRFPMRLPKLGDRAGGAIFYDAGNVFRRLSRITFRTSPLEPRFDDPLDPSRCTANCSTRPNELAYLSHTIGFGFRYATPVGPVRIDFGYQLNPATFRFCNVSVEAPLTSCPAGEERRARLPRFQFFFNIGSIF